MNPFEKKLFKRSSSFLLEFLKKTNITAEELTLFRVFFGFFTAIILLRGIYVHSLLAITFYQFVMFLDYVDGDLARYRNNFKIEWVYFDLMTHIILAVLFLLAVSFSYYLKTDSILFLVLGFMACIFFLLNNVLNKQSTLERRNDIKKNPGKWAKKRFSKSLIVWSLFKIEKPFSLFFILVVLNQIRILIFIYFIIYFLGLSHKFYSEYRSLQK